VRRTNLERKTDDASGDGVRRAGGRSLSWWRFLLIVIVYAAIIQGGGRIIGVGVDADNTFETAGNLLETALTPIALLLVAAVGTSWGNLLDQEADLVLALVVLVCIVGFTED
jgi:hypothetical protein